MGSLEPRPNASELELKSSVFPVDKESKERQDLLVNILDDIATELEKAYPIKSGVIPKEMYELVVTNINPGHRPTFKGGDVPAVRRKRERTAERTAHLWYKTDLWRGAGKITSLRPGKR